MFDSLGEHSDTQAPELKVVEPAEQRPLAHLTEAGLMQEVVELTKTPMHAAGYSPDAGDVKAFVRGMFGYLLSPETRPIPKQLGNSEFTINKFIDVINEIRARIKDSELE